MGKNNKRINGINSSTRACAIHLLMSCNQGSYANELVPSYLNKSNFNSKDKAQITHIVYSTLRSQIRIDSALSKLVDRKLAKLDEIALSALRVVASQIVDGNKSYGVVNDVVTAMPFSMKSFVNALSRKIAKRLQNETFFIDEPDHVSFSLPKWIYQEILDVYENPQQVAHALNSSSLVTLVNINRSTFEIDRSNPGTLLPYAQLVRSKGSISELEQFDREKLISIDQGSVLVSECVDSNKDMSVLDVCAAPGGKSLMISTKANKVVAADITLSRMQRLVENKKRLEVDNISALIADARNLPIDKTQLFDRILIDAPCSGLGVLRRRPDLRLRIKESDIEDLVELQKQILNNAIRHLKASGKLIYSVCTFTRRETIEIDQWLESTYPDLIEDDLGGLNPRLKKLGRGVMLKPSAENDGMYAIRLKSV